ncbi:Qat anti-phage system QueC-like protein QatC [uncultured Muribaculum sp.]|uniref:Qat anti-phage system QueC-like protein QatC n=1 Tax=uncultured Muribaculum sp. TaxID=1918613 RepID=UPI0025B7812E|nr:Qat anti-phage system QueC-like protein QatC [uncultured Muribaculum sp.]
MKESFVFTLSALDKFYIDGSRHININDPKSFQYTFWNPHDGIGKKQMYITSQYFTDEALDLLYISLMVFCADRSISRDIQIDAWTRNFELYIPVKAYEKWEHCKSILIKALNFLTGDHWTIHFREREALTKDEDKYRKGKRHFRNSIKTIDSDVFCMLSGGLDSFIGAINLLNEGISPIFISHYGGGKGVKMYQDKVVNLLKAKYGINPVRFFRFYATSMNGKEDTTRSRSFMFFAHAIAIASGIGHHVELYVPENGVISLNIPLTIMRLGSLSTRTTHPYFMKTIQNLLLELGIDISIINPFQFQTKGEMMKTCKDIDFLNSNYQYTLSCSHPDQGRWTGESVGHCGECLPCTIRKAAIKAAGIDDSTVYRHHYETKTGIESLLSYRLGLATPKDSYAAIQLSGPITERLNDYTGLYERGLQELNNLINSL